MMSQSWLLIALAVSIDAFWCGFALGGKQVKLGFRSALYIGLWPLLMGFIAATMGQSTRHLLPLGWTGYLSAAVLLVAATLSFKDAMGIFRNKTHIPCDHKHYTGENTLLSVAVGLDAAAASFSLGAAGLSAIPVALSMFVAHTVLVLLGNMGGRHSIGRLDGWYVFLPCVLLFGLSLARFMGIS